MNNRRRQKGAALLIVLLLAATLSFVALAAMERTALSAVRTGNVNLRGEALWRAHAVEILTLAAIDDITSVRNSTMSLDDPWATEPIEFPFDGGAARIFIGDATACFNINALNQPYGDGAWTQVVDEFVRLAGHLGLSEFEASALAEAIADWIDEDASRRPQGSEDGYYTTLPSPYRTGNAPMASITELRAVKGVTREIYATMKPYLCLQDASPAVVNVNMLSRRHAPVLAAILGADVSLQAAEDIIAARPPGGWSDRAAFLAAPAIAAMDNIDSARFDVTSRFLFAHAEIVYDTALLEMMSLIETGETKARVIARRLGAEE